MGRGLQMNLNPLNEAYIRLNDPVPGIYQNRPGASTSSQDAPAAAPLPPRPPVPHPPGPHRLQSQFFAGRAGTNDERLVSASARGQGNVNLPGGRTVSMVKITPADFVNTADAMKKDIVASEEQAYGPGSTLARDDRTDMKIQGAHAVLDLIANHPNEIRPSDTLIKCSDGNKPIGLLHIEQADTAFVGRIVTHIAPEYRGTGARLMEQAAGFAKAWNKPLELMPLFEEDADVDQKTINAARQLHEKQFGFVSYDETSYMRLDPADSSHWCEHNGEFRLVKFLDPAERPA